MNRLPRIAALLNPINISAAIVRINTSGRLSAAKLPAHWPPASRGRSQHDEQKVLVMGGKHDGCNLCLVAHLHQKKATRVITKRLRSEFGEAVRHGEGDYSPKTEVVIAEASMDKLCFRTYGFQELHYEQ